MFLHVEKQEAINGTMSQKKDKQLFGRVKILGVISVEQGGM